MINNNFFLLCNKNRFLCGILYLILIYNKFFLSLGPPHIPILGHALITFRRSPEDVIPESIKYLKTYGLVGGAYIGTKVVVFLSDPQDAEIILNNSAHIDKAEEYK